MTFTLYMLGRYAEALDAAQAACGRFPDVPFVHAIKALVHTATSTRLQAAVRKAGF